MSSIDDAIAKHPDQDVRHDQKEDRQGMGVTYHKPTINASLKYFQRKSIGRFTRDQLHHHINLQNNIRLASELTVS